MVVTFVVEAVSVVAVWVVVLEDVVVVVVIVEAGVEFVAVVVVLGVMVVIEPVLELVGVVVVASLVAVPVLALFSHGNLYLISIGQSLPCHYILLCPNILIIRVRYLFSFP